MLPRLRPSLQGRLMMMTYIENQIQFANGSMDGRPDFKELTSSAICFVSQKDMTIWMLEKIALLLGFSMWMKNALLFHSQQRKHDRYRHLTPQNMLRFLVSKNTTQGHSSKETVALVSLLSRHQVTFICFVALIYMFLCYGTSFSLVCSVRIS
jgi:hypothetical protein